MKRKKHNESKALKTLLFIYIVIFTVLLTMCPAKASTDKKTYIPTKAFQYFPLVIIAQEELYPEYIMPGYFGALIEHESCIGLLHKRCWDPTSRLKSKREEGAGLGQLTRAYNKYGGLRFDTVAELRIRYKEHLKELSWDNIYQRPDLQVKAIILLWKRKYDQVPIAVEDEIERIAMADAAYNGGNGGLNRDRRLCGLKKGCDPKYWFNNVEKTCSKSKKPLYGNRSACDINRYHVRDVLTIRLKKYNRLYCKIKHKDI
jgi:hypothetical protein